MLRFTTYNIAFGFNGSSLVHSALNHLILHGTGTHASAKLLSRNVDKAVSLACSTSADFLCLNEVPDSIHSHRVIEKLKSCGYAVIEIAEGQHRPHALRISTILAAKDASANPIPIALPHFNKFRGGGGACAFEAKNKSLVVAGVHLALSPRFRRDQLKELAKFIKLHDSKKDVVLMGDFNCGLDEIRMHPAWQGIPWDGCDENTSRYPVFSWPEFPMNIDHVIFTPRLLLADTKIMKGTSDHHLLTCTIAKQGTV